MKKLPFYPNTIALFFFFGVFFNFFMGITETQAFWTTEGPYGGDVKCLAMASNPDIIYAGTSKGVFKTVDGGTTWTQTAFPPMPLRTIQVAPQGQCQTASATSGNGELAHVVYIGTNVGIYNSMDGLETWDLIGPLWEKVNAIAVDPLKPCLLYAGTGDDDPQSQSIGKIFKSTDGGETWQEKVAYGWMDAVEAILIDSDNSDHIYAGAYGTYGFWKSTDEGENWENSKISTINPNKVYALTMTPAGYSPDAILAIAGDGVYKSTNQGESWVELTNAPSNPLTIAVDPNNPNVIYSGNRYSQGRFFKSNDAGDTWSVSGNGLPRQGRPSSIVIDPRNSTLFVGLPEGAVFKSTDGAENWNFSSQGMTGRIDIADLAIHPASKNTVFAAVKGDGHCLAKTTNGGASWNYLSDSDTNQGAVAIAPQNPFTIYSGIGWAHRGNHQYSLKKSTDEGQSWTRTGYFLITTLGSHYLGTSDIWVNPNNSYTILVAVIGDPIDGAGLYKSTDAGKTWQSPPGLNVSVTTLAADPNDSEIVYIGTEDGYVNRSTDCGGSSWEQITPSDEWAGVVWDIEVDIDSRVWAATDKGLMKWYGNGADHWEKLSGLPSDEITALAIDRSTTPEIFYVGTGGSGIFFSKDGGDSWIPFNEGLGGLSITKLGISATQPKMLYASTAYSGVWSRRLSPEAIPWIPLLLLGN